MRGILVGLKASRALEELVQEVDGVLEASPLRDNAERVNAVGQEPTAMLFDFYSISVKRMHNVHMT